MEQYVAAVADEAARIAKFFLYDERFHKAAVIAHRICIAVF
ncbi:MAG: hypothetical protein AAB518_03850 [Patescibacteria group bacterium]